MAVKSASRANVTVALSHPRCHVALIALVAAACGNAPGAPRGEATAPLEPQAALHLFAAPSPQLSGAIELGDGGGIPVGDAASGAESEAVRVQAYRDSFYATSDIQNSFVTAAGDAIDCIDFYAQQSVKALIAQGTPFNFQTLPSSLAHPSSSFVPTYSPPIDGTTDQNGNTRSCAKGAVPVNRPTVNDIEAAGGLDAYLSLLAKVHPPQAPGEQAELDCYKYTTAGPTYDHAAGYQNLSPLYGMVTVASNYSPQVNNVSSGEHSDSQLWVETGNCEFDNARPPAPPNPCTLTGPNANAVQSIELGWINGATSYGVKTTSVLFASITQTGYSPQPFQGHARPSSRAVET